MTVVKSESSLALPPSASGEATPWNLDGEPALASDRVKDDAPRRRDAAAGGGPWLGQTPELRSTKAL